MDYSSLQEKARFRMVPDMVANASNIAALIYHEMIKQKGPGSVLRSSRLGACGLCGHLFGV